MAASRSMAPGAALLRASRVFSVPPPLAPPAEQISTIGAYNSDTATLPHPTHMSITTPHASLQRGDWGLKRSLPLRSTTKSSTPVIKVKAMDTWEHITEYGSAGDHTLTLQKWQEMGIPITAPIAKNTRSNFKAERGSGKSVFEDDLDTIHNARNGNLTVKDRRWKFDGPWLAGQTDGDFNQYVSGEVRNRKREFREYLRQSLAQEKRQQRISQDGPTDEETPLPKITEAQLETYVKSLRQDTAALNRKIRTFFDIAPVSVALDDVQNSMDWLNPDNVGVKPKNDTHTSDSPYALLGPPKTHPSGGLSYTRTASKLNNHPLFGPQRGASLIEARIVTPNKAVTGNVPPLLGVGGFVTNVPLNDPSFVIDSTQRNIPGTTTPISLVPGVMKIDPTKAGGHKVWVQPKYAYVDPKGKVYLTVQKADVEAVAVKEGRTDELEPRGQERGRGLSERVNSRIIESQGKAKAAGAGEYGL